MAISTLDRTTTGTSRSQTAWQIVRWAVFVLYLGYFWQQMRAAGFPFDRERLILWVVGGLAITCLGRPWRNAVQLVVDWLPIPLVFLAYDLSRGVAENIGMPVLVKPQIWAEKALFLGHIPTVDLQEHLYRPDHVAWWQAVVSACYVSHFVVPFLVAGVLWARNRRLWQQFIARFVTTSFMAVGFFCLFPTAPPWMASDQGHIGPVERIPNHGFGKLGLHSAEGWFQMQANTRNLVAAIPSLHAGFAGLVAAFFWTKVPTRYRPLLLIHPALMSFTIVYGGEHYFVDALAGWATVALAFVLCGWAERRWRERRGTGPVA